MAVIDSRRLARALGALSLTVALGCGTVDRITGVKTACDLRSTGIPAQAEILSIWETGWSVNNEPVIGIRLRVLADDRPAFEAEIPKALIGRLQVPRFQPGRLVPVVYDGRDPSKVGLDIYTCK